MLIPIRPSYAVAAGGANEAETDALIAEMDTPPDATREGHINDLIVALKAAGIWAKLDIFYIIAAHDAQAARLNWVAPTTFAITAVNSPTFTTDRGYAGDGATSYLSTGWNPSTNAVTFTQNDAHMGIWLQTNTTIGLAAMGFATATAGLNIYPRFTDNNCYVRINDNPEAGGFSVSVANGHTLGVRTSSTARTGYRDGADLGSYGSVNSTGLPNDTLLISRLGFGYHTGIMAAAHAGGSLDATESDACYDALQAYMTAVGA